MYILSPRKASGGKRSLRSVTVSVSLPGGVPERIRGSYDDALYKSTFTLLCFTSR